MPRCVYMPSVSYAPCRANSRTAHRICIHSGRGCAPTGPWRLTRSHHPQALADDRDALRALIFAVRPDDALCLALACRPLRDALWQRFPQHPPGHAEARTAAGVGVILKRPLYAFCALVSEKGAKLAVLLEQLASFAPT